MIEESDGSLTLATCDDIEAGSWEKTTLTLPFTPLIDSFTVCADKFYILASDGSLMTSADALTWSAAGPVWTSIVGDYDGTLLGLRVDGSRLLHTSWPATLPETEADPRFPTSGRSQLCIYRSEWTPAASAFLAGGRMSDGSLSSAVWGFDGTGWALLSSGSLPAVDGISLIGYYNKVNTSADRRPATLDLWLAIGGRLADGTLSRNVYISYDNGVNWGLAPDAMQLPKEFTSAAGADALLSFKRMEFDLASYMTRSVASSTEIPTLPGYSLEGDRIFWNCPVVYLFGGSAADGNLIPTLRSGLLCKLAFTPLF